MVEAFVSGDATQVSHDESECAEDRFDESSYHLRHDRHRLLPAQVPRRFVLQKERNIIIASNENMQNTVTTETPARLYRANKVITKIQTFEI